MILCQKAKKSPLFRASCIYFQAILSTHYLLLTTPYGWNKVAGENCTFFTPTNWSAVLAIALDKINIRADPPEVKPGTSVNSRINVPSAWRFTFKRRKSFWGKSETKPRDFSSAERLHSSKADNVSKTIFWLGGKTRYTGWRESTFTCWVSGNFASSLWLK